MVVRRQIIPARISGISMRVSPLVKNIRSTSRTVPVLMRPAIGARIMTRSPSPQLSIYTELEVKRRNSRFRSAPDTPDTFALFSR